VVQPSPFGAQVGFALDRGRNQQGQASNDGDTELAQRVDLMRVVGQQPDGAHSQVAQDAGGGAVLALVGLVAEGQVGFDGIHASSCRL